MAALILHYHPLDESFSAALCDTACDALGATSRVIRLQHEPMDVAALDGITHLVVNAPTWWGSVPARMLEVLNELVGPHVDGHADPDSSPLRQITRLSVIATHGSSRIINRIQGEPGLMLWKHTVLRLCAPNAKFDWIALYKLDRSDATDRSAFIERVRSELSPSTDQVTNA